MNIQTKIPTTQAEQMGQFTDGLDAPKTNEFKREQAARLRQEAFLIPNKSHMGKADYARIGVINAKIRELEKDLPETIVKRENAKQAFEVKADQYRTDEQDDVRALASEFKQLAYARGFGIGHQFQNIIENAVSLYDTQMTEFRG